MLVYVSATRAKKQLLVSSSGKPSEIQPLSRFNDEGLWNTIMPFKLLYW